LIRPLTGINEGDKSNHFLTSKPSRMTALLSIDPFRIVGQPNLLNESRFRESAKIFDQIDCPWSISLISAMDRPSEFADDPSSGIKKIL
jgi:hypothetical protein